MMADAPGHLTLKRHRDLEGRRSEAWVRRALLLLVALFVLAALLNVFGQRSSEASASNSAASLTVSSPTHLRGGLIYQARFEIKATRTLDQPKLVLGSGWFDGLTLNTTEPQPVSEATRDGRVLLIYDTLDAGERLVVWLEYQVNPTTTGRRSQTVELDDGNEPLLTLERSLRVFP
jgi:hypothetical protein